MVDRLLATLDVDPVQWRALVRTSWRVLWRTPSAVAANARTAKYAGLAVGVMFYAMMGLFLAAMAATAPSAGTAAFLLLCFIAIFLGNLILLEFGSTIVSPDDILILGTRPVSSRTYFIARLSIVGVFVVIYASALGAPAAIAFAFRFGEAAALGWLIALLTQSIATAMAMIVIYTTAIRYIPAARIRSALGYVQMVLSFSIYAGFAVMQTQFRSMTASLNVLPTWTVILPPSWFAGFVALAQGSASLPTMLNVITAASLLLVLGRLLMGRIALQYMEDVVAVGTTTTEVKRLPVRGRQHRWLRLLPRPEDRAIALLIGKQFRYDTKFKMAILGILPLTLLYLYQGVQGSGTLGDPFAGQGITMKTMASGALLHIAIVIFPMLLAQEISWSESFHASWIFFATPTDRTALVLAVRRVLLVFFILPYLFMLSLVFLYFFGNPLHVAMHALVLLLITNLLLQAQYVAVPKMPFSTQRGVGSRMSAMMVMMVLAPFVMVGTMGVFMRFLYPVPALYWAGVGGLLLLNFLLTPIMVHRVKTVTARLEFAA